MPKIVQRNPEISVVVPVYNVEKYVARCLESLVQQTLSPKEFEIIVIDDSSTDESLEKVRDFIEKNPLHNFKLFSNKENLGLGPTRNRAIEKAQGEYLFFLDSDDFLDVTALEKLLMFGYDNESDVVLTGFYRIREDDRIVLKKNLKLSHFIKKSSILAHICSFDISPMACNRLIKRDLFIKNNIKFPATLHEDVLSMFMIYFYAKTINYYDDFLYYWLVRDSSITGRISKRHLDNFLDALIARENFLYKNINPGLLKKLDGFLSSGVHNVSNTLYSRIVKNSSINYTEKRKLLGHLYMKLRKVPHSERLMRNMYSNKPVDKFIEFINKDRDIELGIRHFIKYLNSKTKDDKKSCTKVNAFKEKTSVIYRYLKRSVSYHGNFFARVDYFIDQWIIYFHKRRLRKRKASKILKKIYRKDVQETIKYDVLFFCEANYHIRNAVSILRNLTKCKKVGIVNMAEFLSHGRRALTSEEYDEYSDICFVEFDNTTYSKIDKESLQAAIFFNDWGLNSKFIRELRHKRVVTIGINEGVNDFLKLAEGFTSKVSPYRTCEQVFLPGKFDTQFFVDRPGQYNVVGLPMINNLYKEKIFSPKKPLAVINVNFSYGVLTHCRDEFIKTAIEGCKKAKIDYIITQHPMDLADLSDYKVSDKNMYDTIREGSIFISRFSGAIIESLAMGKPCVYHNPHNEQVVKFQEPLGAYSISDSAESLAEAIKYELKRSSKTPVREYSRDFMELHANIHSEKEPEELITETILRLIEA